MTTYEEKLEWINSNAKKEFQKYYKAMSHRVMSVEIEVFYDLMNNISQKCELGKRWESKIKEILSRK